MRSKISKLLAAMALVGLSAVPLQSVDAQPWGFNCCGMSVGQNWGWGPGWWGGGPWGYPGWGYPYGAWGHPGWWGPPPPPPLVIVMPAVNSGN
jgi:hypothetical protein